MIELYHNDMSVCAQKVRFTLGEKTLPWTSHHLNLRAGDQQKPEYVKLNPSAVVPTLVDDGNVVIESTVINEYLEDEYPYPPLMPSDSEGRARARLMEDFRDTHFNPYFVHIIQETRKPEGERDEQRIQNAKAEITKGLDRIESELQDREYLAGPFSLADVAFMSNLELLDRFSIPVDANKYKRTVAWIDRLKARPSFAASAT